MRLATVGTLSINLLEWTRPRGKGGKTCDSFHPIRYLCGITPYILDGYLVVQAQLRRNHVEFLIDCFAPGVMLPSLKCNTRTTTIIAPIGTSDKLAAESLIADANQIMRIWIRNLLNRPGKPTTGKLSLVSSEECRPAWQLLLRHTHPRILQFGAS